MQSIIEISRKLMGFGFFKKSSSSKSKLNKDKDIIIQIKQYGDWYRECVFRALRSKLTDPSLK